MTDPLPLPTAGHLDEVMRSHLSGYQCKSALGCPDQGRGPCAIGCVLMRSHLNGGPLDPAKEVMEAVAPFLEPMVDRRMVYAAIDAALHPQNKKAANPGKD